MSRELPINQIDMRPDARALEEAAVASLAESIGTVGLINPIRVRSVAGRWEVIAGAHRLAACKALGLVEIESIIVDDDDLRAELAMIDENLCRAELSPSDRAKQTARRKAIYLELHPETGHGGNTGGPCGQFVQTVAPSFAADTAKVIGKDERTIRRDVARGENILASALDLISGTHLDTGSYLDKLRKLNPSDQMRAVERDLAFHRQQDRERQRQASASKIQADIKARAAKEVAEILAEHVPGEWWDALKSNLYASGAKAVADAFTNITGQSIMDARFGP